MYVFPLSTPFTCKSVHQTKKQTEQQATRFVEYNTNVSALCSKGVSFLTRFDDQMVSLLHFFHDHISSSVVYAW